MTDRYVKNVMIYKTVRCPKCGNDDDIPHDDDATTHECFLCGTPMQEFTTSTLDWQFRLII